MQAVTVLPDISEESSEDDPVKLEDDILKPINYCRVFSLTKQRLVESKIGFAGKVLKI